MVKKANNMEDFILKNDSDDVDFSEYISYLYSCETTSFTLKKRLMDINELVKQVLDMSKDDEKKTTDDNNIINAHRRYIRQMNIMDVGILVALFLVIASIVACILSIKAMTVSKYAYITFSVIVILCSILFVSMMANKKKSIKSKTETNNYELIDSLTLTLLTEEKDEVNKRLKLVSNEIEKICNYENIICLKNIYDGIIPISVIYGYFDTGRCDTIENAVELFVNEKESGIITIDVNELFENLNSVNQSMYYAKLAIEVCESELENLKYNNGRMMDSVSQLYEENLTETQLRKKIAIIKKQSSNNPYYDGITKYIMASRL